TVSDLQGMLELASRRTWRPPIVRTIASTGEGVDELYGAIVSHRQHMEASGEAVARREARLREELRALVAARMSEQADALCTGEKFDAVVASVAGRELD